MRKYWPAVIAASITLTTMAAAQEPAPAGAAKVATAEVSVGTAIENRMLVGQAETFPRSAGKLFCFSRISNAEGSEIEHVWYKGDTEAARVKLAIGGSPWRTHSSKRLGEDGAGEWRCDVVQGDKVIQSVKFKVE